MVRVSSITVARKLTINAGAACFGMFEIFQDNHSGAFTHNKTVAIFFERAGGVLGVLVARAHGFHRAESANANRNNSGFSPAGEHDFGIAHLDGAPGFTNRVIGGGPSPASGEVMTAPVVVHREHAGGHVRN